LPSLASLLRRNCLFLTSLSPPSLACHIPATFLSCCPHAPIFTHIKIGFFRSIALAGDQSLQDILRLLTLWFSHAASPEVNQKNLNPSSVGFLFTYSSCPLKLLF
jgi:hypothetical protein